MIVSREICIYQKEGDKLLTSIEINIPIRKIIEVLDIDKKNDPKVYLIYKINESQFLKLKEFVPKLLDFDFRKVEIYYECYQMS
jgi:hypothetical protein